MSSSPSSSSSSSRPSSPSPSSSPSSPSSPSSQNTLDTSTNTIVGNGFVVETTQTVDTSGNVNTHTTFTTTDQESDIQVFEDLSGNVQGYYDNTANTQTSLLLGQIKDYADKIKCTDFQGKGTIEDYSVLFSAASKIANESKHMQLDVDVEGFNEFAAAADELSNLFSSFIVKLNSVNIIDDTVFLTAIVNALNKIWKLSETFGKFKETIFATSQIQLPQSTHDTRVAVESVAGQLNCAMKYISYFVDGTSPAPSNSQLSQTEQSIISNAVSTIDNWNNLCEQGVSIAMSTNPDIVFIKNTSDLLKQNTTLLTNATSKLRTKLSLYRIQ